MKKKCMAMHINSIKYVDGTNESLQSKLFQNCFFADMTLSMITAVGQTWEG